MMRLPVDRRKEQLAVTWTAHRNRNFEKSVNTSNSISKLQSAILYLVPECFRVSGVLEKHFAESDIMMHLDDPLIMSQHKVENR